MPDQPSRGPLPPLTDSVGRVASAAERANWLLEYLVPHSAASNVVLALRSEAPLDVDALSQAFAAVTDRHAALRSRFALAGGVLTRTVRPRGEPSAVDVVRVPEEQVQAALRAVAQSPFTISTGGGTSTTGQDGHSRGLLRSALVRSPSADVLCVVGHHAVFDGTSAVLLTREVVRAYGALKATDRLPPDLETEVPELPPVPPSSAAVDYWRRQLAGVSIRSMDLRCDRPRPTIPSFDGDQHIHTLSGHVHRLLAEAEAKLRSTRHLVLLAAYLLVLSRHGAGPDLTVGLPVDLRGAAGQGAIGFHTHTLVLRLDIGAARTFRQLVEMTRDAFLEALQHADTSIDDVLERVGSFGDSTENEYFHHVFNFFDYPTLVEGMRWTPDGPDVEVVEVSPRHSIPDLELVVRSRSDSTQLVVLHGTDMLDCTDAVSLVMRFETLLRSGLLAPESPLAELAWHSDDDRRALATRPAAVPRWEGGLLAAVAARAGLTPDAVAVVDAEAGTTTTYAALMDAAARMHEALQEVGVGRGDTVVVDAERRPATIAAVLAVWASGAAYLPVDRNHPAPRVARSLAVRRVAAVVGPRLAAETGPALPTVALVDPRGAGPWRSLEDVEQAAPDAVALVTATSGSTGAPKSVCLTHDNMSHAARSFADLGHLDRRLGAVLWHTPFTFEPSTLEAFAPLTLGGSVLAAPDAARHDPMYLLDLLGRHRVALIQGTPSVWRDLADALEGRCAGMDLVSGGEPLNASTARALLMTGARVINAYGTTETAGWPVFHEIDPALVTDGLLPAGRPVGGHQVQVTGEDGRPLPPGLRGEIRISGRSVTVGYADDLDSRTVASGGGRTHPTGDIGRWRADGILEVLGRADRQVKLLGIRFEPAEVEAVLESHPGVERCGVVLTGDQQTPMVVAVVETSAPLDPALLRAYALAHLPPVAVPARVIAVERMPRTSSGKVAHVDLFDVIDAHPHDPRIPVLGAPADELTARLTEAWRDILGDAGATPATDFFAAGGSSMRAILLCERVEELTGHVVSLSSLLRRRTPASLTEHLAQARPTADG